MTGEIVPMLAGLIMAALVGVGMAYLTVPKISWAKWLSGRTKRWQRFERRSFGFMSSRSPEKQESGSSGT